MKKLETAFSLLLVFFLATGSSLAQSTVELTGNHLSFKNIPFRHIGPGQAGGRISDIEVYPGHPDTLFIAASTGGIFKTTNAGHSWQAVFDQAGSSLSIGDMEISATNPRIMWAGTGEASGEQSAGSVGDGVYLSQDGGLSWINKGLAETRHISRIRIHPDNPDIVYVAATGSRWGACRERGVFKTVDGGDNWKKILFIDDNTGVSDLIIHPDGKTILASAWQQRRNAWAHVRTGPESGLFRSVNEGKDWEKLNIFPDQTIGRIALWMAPSNPDIIYACLESDQGGLYRSDNAGETWKLVNSKQSTSYWYGRLYGNPLDPDHLFVMGVHVNESTDGGKTFTRMPAENVHVDHHILWLNPDNTKHRILGNDGGIYFTYDAGENWQFVSNLPINQYYAISIDNVTPYTVYGGLQDNGVWGGPSRSSSGTLVTNSDIVRICGGDGFYSAADPNHPYLVYGESQYGYMVRRDLRTRSSHLIKPIAPDGMDYRFNWNSPFFISTHPPHSIYLGGNYVFKSDNRGDHWRTISSDLSRNRDLSEELVIGQKPLLKPYASITALAESPLKPGYLMAGTDDGNLLVSLDDGNSWMNISDRVPCDTNRFFTRILWSVADVSTAYVACARYYEADDLSPYIFKTTNYGQTWERITTGLPTSAVIKSLAQHPDNPDLLFAGSHNSLYISLNNGMNWLKPDWDLPPVAIDDIKLAFPDNDLVLGSYGRGIIILDDLSFLSELQNEAVNRSAWLFQPRAYDTSPNAVRHPDAGSFDWHAPDPEKGLSVTVLVNDENLSEIRLQVTDPHGTVCIDSFFKVIKGFNRILLDPEKLPGEYAIIRMVCKDGLQEKLVKSKY